MSRQNQFGVVEKYGSGCLDNGHTTLGDAMWQLGHFRSPRPILNPKQQIFLWSAYPGVIMHARQFMRANLEVERLQSVEPGEGARLGASQEIIVRFRPVGEFISLFRRCGERSEPNTMNEKGKTSLFKGRSGSVLIALAASPVPDKCIVTTKVRVRYIGSQLFHPPALPCTTPEGRNMYSIPLRRINPL
jgi:hypothetical protein